MISISRLLSKTSVSVFLSMALSLPLHLSGLRNSNSSLELFCVTSVPAAHISLVGCLCKHYSVVLSCYIRHSGFCVCTSVVVLESDAYPFFDRHWLFVTKMSGRRMMGSGFNGHRASHTPNYIQKVTRKNG